jgi:ferritin
MLTEKMEVKLNEHINAELFSAYLYLSMSAYFKSIELPGFANWMQVQFEEEMTHAMKFFGFVDNMDGRIRLTTIQAPPVEWESPLEVFEQTYEHEKSVSKQIFDLVSLSLEENDHATNNFLQWFVAEQVEEESSVKSILGKLKFIGDSKSGLFMVDQELAKRTFTAESATE